MDRDGVLDQSWRACNRAAPAWVDVCASPSRVYAPHGRCGAPASCRHGSGHLCARTRTGHSTADIVVRTAVCAAWSQRVSRHGATGCSRSAAVLRAATFNSRGALIDLLVARLLERAQPAPALPSPSHVSD